MTTKAERQASVLRSQRDLIPGRPEPEYRELKADRLDGWQNTLTGFGTDQDKTMYAQFGARTLLSPTLLEILYSGDDIVRLIVNTKPEEMLRQGYEVTIPDSDTSVTPDLERLELDAKVQEAMIWGRLYGGAVLVLGIDDGLDAGEPVNEKAIKSLTWANVVDRRYLEIVSRYSDPSEKNYNRPEVYRFSQNEVNIHASRTVAFGGLLTDVTRKQQNRGWDDSVITPVYDVIRQFAQSWQGTALMMTDANQGIMKIKGLIDMIAENDTETMQTRMAFVDMARSIARSLIIDAEDEDFRKEQTLFAGVSEILDRFMMRLSAAARIPVTILMGRSPAGMSATGASDFRQFYDSIRTEQKRELAPKLNQVLRYLFLSKQGPTRGQLPEAWQIDFKSLWQQTTKEEADEQKARGETASIMIDRGVWLSEEVALSMVDGKLGRTTNIDRELRKASLASDEVATNVTKSLLTPSDMAKVITVNQALAAEGLPKDPNPTIGSMKVSEYFAMQQAKAKALLAEKTGPTGEGQ